MRRLSKALAAVTAGVALLVLSAAPGAAVSQNVAITGGTVSVNLVPTLTQPLGTTSTDPSCTSSLTNHWDSTTSWTSGHGAIALVSPFAYSGGNYVLVLTYSSIHTNSTHITTGTDASKWNIVSSGSTGSGFTISDVNIYATTGVGSCTHTTSNPICGNIDVNFAGGFTGILTPNGAMPTTHVVPVSSTVHLAGVGSIVAAGCAPPFAAMNGKTATISSMTGHFTT